MTGSTIYTRGGDKGETSLADGSRAAKDALRVRVYGTIDEANSWIGAARAFSGDALLDRTLELLQHRYFNCSSNVATPPDSEIVPPAIDAEDVRFLERAIDAFEARTGPVTYFVLPGGSQGASFLHVARTVCRRAERLLVALAAEEPVDAMVMKFVNRSSDLLFAAARYANAVESLSDVRWNKDLPLPDLDRE